MRAILAAVLLVSAALAGCVQQGEELDPAAGADANASDDGDGTDTEDTSNGSSDDAGDANDGGSAGSSDSSGNQTSETTSDSGTEADSSNDGSEGDAGSTDQPQPKPFELTSSVSMGYLAVVGADWIGGPLEGLVGDNGFIDADHCHMANVTVPSGTETFSVLVHDEPADPDEPGVGAYQVTLHRPNGSTTEVDWVDAQTGDGSMNWSTSDPAEGNWTIETDPIGPAANQAWTLDLTVAGEATQPPTLLQAETTC